MGSLKVCFFFLNVSYVCFICKTKMFKTFKTELLLSLKNPAIFIVLRNQNLLEKTSIF